MLSRIKKNDVVFVVAGADKGKQGQVLAINNKTGRVTVKDVSVRTHHAKGKRQGEKGGIKKEEGFIALSNVMPLCPACKKPCRVQMKVLAEGNKARVCHRCKEAF